MIIWVTSTTAHYWENVQPTQCYFGESRTGTWWAAVVGLLKWMTGGSLATDDYIMVLLVVLMGDG